jgi:predicted aconitase
MDAYDLDGTLADVNFAQAAVRSLATVFAQAPVIYTPEEPFIVITGRPHANAEQTRATTKWLQDNQPQFKAIYYVDGSELEMIQPPRC